ncbi:MAG TPA: NfeD family protein [Myxococcales bacterium]|jgi:membrane protein implicated in regulation of membrane protease activity|nr:NfeD family protein [Myxococcales bacterium]
MHPSGWELWVAAALLLAGGELLHGAFVLLAFALACLPAALASALGAGLTAQVLCFAAAALVEVPLLARWAHGRRTRRLVTNAEAIIGKRVRVVQPVTEDDEGVVLLTGEHWKARSLVGEIVAGAEAQVVQREGLCLLIIPLERGSP